MQFARFIYDLFTLCVFNKSMIFDVKYKVTAGCLALTQFYLQLKRLVHKWNEPHRPLLPKRPSAATKF